MEKRQALLDPPADPQQMEWGEAEERLLEHASALIATRGIAGLTIAELAREARVSRPTIYRRWASADEVVRAALLRQTMVILQQLDADVAAREDLVAQALRFADLFQNDPVFRRLLATDPEAFTQYSLERIGSSQRVILSWLAEAIVRCQQGGTVREGNAGDISVMLLLIVQSAILSHQAVSSLIGAAEWRTELGRAIDGYLKP